MLHLLKKFNKADIIVSFFFIVGVSYYVYSAARGSGTYSGSLEMYLIADQENAGYIAGSTDSINNNFRILQTTINWHRDNFIRLTNYLISGTTLYVSSASVDGQTLLARLSASNVGIGLVNPTAKLDISGTVSMSDIFTSSGTTQLGDASGDTVLIRASSFTFVNASSISVNGASLSIDDGTLFIDNINNRVGFNTPSPSHLITANRTLDGDALLGMFVNPNSGTAAESTIYVSNTGVIADSLYLQAIGTGFTTAGGLVQDAGILASGTGLGGGLSIMSRAAAPIRFYTDGTTTERMRLNSSNSFLRIAQTTDCDTVTPGNTGEICVQNSPTCPVTIATATAIRSFACVTFGSP